MPSKIKQIQIRLPWLRKLKGDRADQIAKSILDHPNVRQQVEEGRCPVCGKLFDECEYFKRIEEDD